MSYQNIKLEIKDKTAWITIDRESKLNALNKETIGELKSAVEEAENDGSVRGLIITGSGQKAFVAGADIQEFLGKSKEEAMALSEFGHELMDRIANLSKPVIAAINGFALGGGLELALACHLRVASNSAKMGLPEVSLGLIPGYGGTQRLTGLVGKGKALEMILTGDMIDAQDALQWGLVNKVVELYELEETAQNILNKIFSRSKTAVATAIKTVNSGLDKNKDGFKEEIDAFGVCFGSDDFKEGVSAFLEKRKANF
ncbi:enoyl-CoA hydratase/isomerase family protein [Sphingobacterium daejeonense]|uniref:enoyl-CoA hydratase/isomerase family protein n=1 Tax=Sphingobacterium daejeonense TaxID=371142 RepID=UPI0010C35629|nr:enoyl-CoA hydratase-related protein [Sphingobacterium daejeonense]VTQ07651.1 Probable enoyl-CoA hydratase echA8 [Sphingobacterium daejeonense]